MIRIKASFDGSRRLIALTVDGHAGYADKGFDIYCAAVSAVFLGGLNCLDDPKERYEAKAVSGFGHLTVRQPISDHDRVVLEVMARELKDIADTYPDYVRYQEETK